MIHKCHNRKFLVPRVLEEWRREEYRVSVAYPSTTRSHEATSRVLWATLLMGLCQFMPLWKAGWEILTHSHEYGTVHHPVVVRRSVIYFLNGRSRGLCTAREEIIGPLYFLLREWGGGVYFKKTVPPQQSRETSSNSQLTFHVIWNHVAFECYPVYEIQFVTLLTYTETP